MSVAVFSEIVSGRAPAPLSFTVAEFHKMLADGILADGAPVELIDGVIMQKDRAAAGEEPMSHGERHAVGVARVQRILQRHIDNNACHVRTQLPITLPPRSEPEPDITLVAGEDSDYIANHPGPGETLLVIEVADSSLEYDRSTKQAIYAAAQVREYWIVNLVYDQIEVYQPPISDHRCYSHRTAHKIGDTVSLPISAEAAADVPVGDFIPPRV
jgi:Uma2 family endonuclease